MAKRDSVMISLRSVSEVRFLMTTGRLGDEYRGDNLQIGFMNNIQPNLEENLFVLHFGVQYTLDNEVILESVYSFEFEIPNLEQYVTKDEQGKIQVTGIMPHLVSVAVGTMRGILVVKTSGTDLAKYPIPMMDPVSLCNNLAK